MRGVNARGGADECGSVLMLLPAGVLILLVLAAATVDAAVAFMGQREAAALSSRAASDVTVAAADAEAFYTDGGVLRIDQSRLAQAAEATVADGASPLLEVTGVEASCDDVDGLRVTVRVTGEVEVVFAPAVAELNRWEVTAATTMLAEEAGVHTGECSG